MRRLLHDSVAPPSVEEALANLTSNFNIGGTTTASPPAGSANASRPVPQPISTNDRSHNALRPAFFREMIGQERPKRMMQRVVESALRRDTPLDHVLLVGAAGTGKSTFSHVIANELGVDVFEAEAPISHETLTDLRPVMQHGDILRIEEIHQQAIMARRGRDTNTQPEVLYALMEDFVMLSGNKILEFPRITIIGTTTDEGMLPDPFLARFPLRPRLEAYGTEELLLMARWNAGQLGLSITDEAADMFANASRGVPRQINNYVKNAAMLSPDGRVNREVANDVLDELNGVSPDGLTPDMQNMLTFLYTRGKRTRSDGEVTYQASVNTIATAIGKSRDSKGVAMRVEPYLIEKGYVQVGGGGRMLTDAGVERARELIG